MKGLPVKRYILVYEKGRNVNNADRKQLWRRNQPCCVSCSCMMVGVRRVLHPIHCKLRGQSNASGLKLNYFTVIVEVGFSWDERGILFFL